MKQKLYNFITIAFSILEYLFVCIRLFLIKLRLKLTKGNWYLSRNRNFYNPTLVATVYKYGDIWRIARYNSHFGHFENKKDAMNAMFQEWLEENKILDTTNALQSRLKNINKKISSTYEGYKDFYKNKRL